MQQTASSMQVILHAHYQRTLRKDAGIPREALYRVIEDLEAYPDDTEYPRYGWEARVDFVGATDEQIKELLLKWKALGIHMRLLCGSRSIESFLK